MGVFTVGRQVALEIDMPGWWLANSSVDMDFRRGLYYDSSTANPRAATDFLSCVRASTGYAKTAEGTLTQFASNALRITSAGLLVEDARTNLQFDSQALSTGNWTAAQLTSTTDNSTIAPDGTTTACSIIPNGTAATTHRRSTAQPGGIPTSTGTTYAVSIYMKAGTYGFGFLSVVVSGTGYGIIVNLSSGAVTETNTAGAVTGTSNSVETLGNGWYRASVTINGVTGSNIFINTGPMNAATAASWHSGGLGPNFAGDSVSNAYFWGGQIEAGAFPSSYIPTTGAAATRAADAVTCTGNIDTLLAALPQSIIMNISHSSDGANIGTVNIVGKGGYAQMYTGNSNTQFRGFLDGGNTVVCTINGAFSAGVKIGIAQGTEGNGCSLCGAGGTVVTDAAEEGASGLSLASGWYGYCSRLTVWNSKLADATLQALTT